MVNYEDLPSYESMKQHIRRGWYQYGDLAISRPKGTEGPLQHDWYYSKGWKPHSHCWGRKPYWRKKRREQRRAKHHQLSCSQLTSQLGVESEIFFARENENTTPYTFGNESCGTEGRTRK